MEERIKDLLNQLVSDPKESQIQVDFDINRKVFILSVLVYKPKNFLPKTVVQYVEARKNRTFKPHATSFLMDQGAVRLIQEIPFRWGIRSVMREEILEFLRLAKRCHRMLYEIAIEETYQVAMLDSKIAE